MADETPLLDVLASMTWSSMKACTLPPRELMLARIAALASVGAPPVSYLANAETAMDAGITLDDVEGLLIAVAPIIGSARAVTAAGNVARALGYEVSAIEARFEQELRPAAE
jgi:alkylhydroperoxidase/carboxymuconolactone decarboxylase family protein YurZ